MGRITSVSGKCKVRRSGKLMFALTLFEMKPLLTWHGVLMVCTAMTYIAAHTKCMTAGQAIALVHHPPRITIHSIQDGREEHSLPFVDRLSESSRLTGVWWLKDEREAEVDSIPDIFKRGLDIVRLCIDNWRTHADPTLVKVRICPLCHQAPTSFGSSFGQLAGTDVCIHLLFSMRQPQPELQGYPAVLLSECLLNVQTV